MEEAMINNSGIKMGMTEQQQVGTVKKNAEVEMTRGQRNFVLILLLIGTALGAVAVRYLSPGPSIKDVQAQRQSSYVAASRP